MQAFNIEQTNFAIDSVKDTITTVDAMKAASKTLKTEFKKVNIDKIDDLQDDLADMMEDMNEVQDVLGRSYDVGEDVDEADLDAELDALGDELELGDEYVRDAWIVVFTCPALNHADLPIQALMRHQPIYSRLSRICLNSLPLCLRLRRNRLSLSTNLACLSHKELSFFIVALSAQTREEVSLTLSLPTTYHPYSHTPPPNILVPIAHILLRREPPLAKVPC